MPPFRVTGSSPGVPAVGVIVPSLLGGGGGSQPVFASQTPQHDPSGAGSEIDLSPAMTLSLYLVANEGPCRGLLGDDAAAKLAELWSQGKVVFDHPPGRTFAEPETGLLDFAYSDGTTIYLNPSRNLWLGS